MITDWGLDGSGARRSMTTLRGGGGIFLPEMVIILRPTWAGGCGGASRTTRGWGVTGRGGCWRMMSGGAGEVTVLLSCCTIISPGDGGVGGRR